MRHLSFLSFKTCHSYIIKIVELNFNLVSTYKIELAERVTNEVKCDLGTPLEAKTLECFETRLVLDVLF